MRGLAFWLVLSGSALANVPAAYYACEDLEELARCRQTGYGQGQCVLDTLCDDDLETPWNECMLCGDGCRGLPSGHSCVMSDGNSGACVRDEACQDEPERSFDECNHCEAEAPTAPEPAGCSAVDAAIVVPWAVVLAGAGWSLRRRRRQPGQ